MFVEALSAGALQRFAAEPGFYRLVEAASEHAKSSHSAVARLLDDRTIARFALRLERLAAAREWRQSAAERPLAALDDPVAAFAARALGKLDRKVRRRGRGFRSLTAPGRHRLRIAIEHMRYATEFFGAISDEKSATRFARRAADLQDALGALNDAANAVGLVSKLVAGREAELGRVAGRDGMVRARERRRCRRPAARLAAHAQRRLPLA